MTFFLHARDHRVPSLGCPAPGREFLLNLSREPDNEIISLPNLFSISPFFIGVIKFLRSIPKMFSSFIHSSVFTSSLFLFIAASHALFLPSLIANTTLIQNVQKAVFQQNLALAPPFPILRVGWEHIMGQIGANATKAENQSVAEMNAQHATLIQEIDTPAQCGPGLPCSDGSCCNSVGHDHCIQSCCSTDPL